MIVFKGSIGCLKGRTDFCPSPRDSSFDCVGERAASNRVRTWPGGEGVEETEGAKYVVSKAIQALSI